MTPKLEYYSPSKCSSEGFSLGQTLIMLIMWVHLLRFAPSLPCRGLAQELTLSYDPHGAHFSMALFLRRACGLDQLSQVMFRLIGQEWPVIRLITATPHQVMAAQRGTGSVWRAARDWVYSRWGAAGGLQCLLARAVLGSASEQGHISHHCQKFGGSPHVWTV